MNERLPYEEQLAQQWNDLPLPDENMAWADMKRRLEEDDDDSFIPFWLRGCALWGLLAVLLLGLGWWIVRPEKWFVKKGSTAQREIVVKGQEKEKKSEKEKESGKENNRPAEEMQRERNKNVPALQVETKQPGTSEDRLTGTTVDSKKKKNIIPADTTRVVIEKNTRIRKRTSPASSTSQPLKKKQDLVTQNEEKEIVDPENPPLKNNEPVVKVIGDKKSDVNNKQVTDSLKDPNQKNIDKPQTVPTGIVINKKDTGQIKKVDSLGQKKPAITKTKEPPKDSAKAKRVSFAAGLALQQQLPINGQKLTPYNAEGRKGNLSDYIPSVYLRMYKNEKWFIQAEFRYGAPQYTKEFLYSQKRDSIQGGTYITSNSLKKTFYHQLPVSFNYFVSRNWSIGAGLVWNKFVGAVSGQDKIVHNNITGTDSVISKDVIVHSKEADSAFVKSYFQAVLESQYKWKRFSLGARYSFGLQPYIKFTLPGGVQQQEKNSSLQIFLRYELWRSKKK